MDNEESPDFLMDISEAGTVTADNISTSSASPTISNRAESEVCIVKTSGMINAESNKNRNSIQLATSTSISYEESLENRNSITIDSNNQIQKLTPVHHHPLMFEDEVEDSRNIQNKSNFPDVVLAHHQPVRLAQPENKTQADLFNSVNNNTFRKPFYREPSPVSHFSINIMNV